MQIIKVSLQLTEIKCDPGPKKKSHKGIFFINLNVE